MTEQIKRSILFNYRDPRVFDKQQSGITKAGYDENGNPLFIKGGNLDNLVRLKSWSMVTASHRHESDQIVSVFGFTTRLLDRDTDTEILLEAAVFNMQAWMRENDLPEDIYPSTVELRSIKPRERSSQHIDLTQEAIAVMGCIASFNSIGIEDF